MQMSARENNVQCFSVYKLGHITGLSGGGVQGQISWKHDFEITGDPKGPPSGSTF